MKASPADQLRLVEIAELDAAAHQAEHARQNPPQAARVKELLAERQAQSGELARLLGIRDDAKAELARIEADVAVVDARAERDAGRLTATTSAKDAQGLEHEIASLARRKTALEDAELEVMERLESLDSDVAAQEALVAATNEEGSRLSAEGKAAVAEAATRLEAAQRDRAAVAGSVSAELLAMYERIAARGIGAGVLRRQTCEACRMVLSGNDLQRVRKAAADDVVTCPECGAVLVRTDESGL
ncbi:zinc ribbon domain-containing protein [Microbacterium sp.]|uniref:zinc ribbon domain-containing protein n=1 Tax=Microbacterium sp. TaxID=51671 RepID=UPI003A89D15D